MAVISWITAIVGMVVLGYIASILDPVVFTALGTDPEPDPGPGSGAAPVGPTPTRPIRCIYSDVVFAVYLWRNTAHTASTACAASG